MSLSETRLPLIVGADKSAIARWQQGISIVLFCSIAGLLVWGVWAGVRGAIWMAAWVASLHPLTLALQLCLSISVSRQRGAVLTANLWGPWRAWLGEWWISLLRFAWWQPWLWRRWPDSTTTMAGRRGVVFVHGYVCNRGLWQRWMAELTRRQHPFVAVNLEPIWGSIDEYPERIEQAVQRLTALTGLAPLIVAHSMGGVATRAWLRAMPDARARVAHIVTIGTPHHGTWLARWGHSTNAIQMQEGSAWLQDLAQSEAPDVGTHFTCWHSEGDSIVFPRGVAVLSGCQERHLPWVGHVAMVDHPTVMHDTLELLGKL